MIERTKETTKEMAKEKTKETRPQSPYSSLLDVMKEGMGRNSGYPSPSAPTSSASPRFHTPTPHSVRFPQPGLGPRGGPGS